jgi:hypothetical protein
LLPTPPMLRPVGLPTCWTPPHVSNGFRPRGFSPPRRLTPASVLDMLQSSRTRFAAFPPGRPQPQPRLHSIPKYGTVLGHCRGTTPRFPNSATPLEESHSPVAVPHHCGRCLLAVRAPLLRSLHPEDVAPRAPLPVQSEDVPGHGPSRDCQASLSTGRSTSGRNPRRCALSVDNG